MATTNTHEQRRCTPNRISAVAVPRRQPRRARRLTPGSMASARNTEIASSTNSPLKLVPEEPRGDRAEEAEPEHDDRRHHPAGQAAVLPRLVDEDLLGRTASSSAAGSTVPSPAGGSVRRLVVPEVVAPRLGLRCHVRDLRTSRRRIACRLRWIRPRSERSANIREVTGELLIVTGPPGAGKSTAAAVLVEHARAERPRRGRRPSSGSSGGAGSNRGSSTSQAQNEAVTEAAGAATGRFVAAGYWTVYDGVVGPWFLPRFVAATGLERVHYVVLLPSVDTCVERVATPARARVHRRAGDPADARRVRDRRPCPSGTSSATSPRQRRARRRRSSGSSTPGSAPTRADGPQKCRRQPGRSALSVLGGDVRR